MNINDLQMIFQFFGGLGLFLYGMNIMAENLQKSAGGKLKSMMGSLTKNKFTAILIGFIVTALVQSSSATTVMVVGFVNAGILELSQAVGVIMGANIGTTVTAWLVSMSEWSSILKPAFFAPVFVGIGSFILLFSKKEKSNKVAGILVGVGCLFIGLSFMSGSIEPYKDSPVFTGILTTLGGNPFLAVLAGAVVTGIIQSSAASIGILQTLAISGIVDWKAAVFILLGETIGTCVTALISSAGASKNAKRASVIHLLFNVIGSTVFGIIMFIVFIFMPDWADSSINSVQISLFHTAIKVMDVIILFPCSNLLIRMSMLIVKDGPEEPVVEDEAAAMSRRLDKRILNNAAFAIQTAVKEVAVMGELAIANTKLACDAMLVPDKEKEKEVFEKEDVVDKLDNILTTYLVEVDNLALTEEQHVMVKNLFYSISDIERISDHSNNIALLAQRRRKGGIEFSKKGYKDLETIIAPVLEGLEDAITSRIENDRTAAQRVADLETQVDELEKDIRDKHIQRLSKGKCEPESGVIFLDVLTNLERVSDHALNISEYVLSEM